MQMIPLPTSRTIEAVGHEGDKLTVAFRNGSVYTYHAFPAKEFDKLLGAESPGKHFGVYIRGRYEHTKHP